MQRLTFSDSEQNGGSFTPDGSTLAFVESHKETGWDISLLDMKTKQVSPFLNSEAFEAWPEISPDGRWLAYASNETGQLAVWVRPFPGPGGRWQISNEGGSAPVWSRDGRRIFYWHRTGGVWVSDVRAEGGFSASRPRLLFENGELVGTNPIRGWDVSPDGRGFLAVRDETPMAQPATEITLVQNWFEELKRLCPTGRN